MKQDKNWPQLSAARIDDMVAAATAYPQERRAPIYASRPALALAASIVLVIAVAASWSVPRYAAPRVESTAVSADSSELSDYMMYELLEDLT